MRKLKDLIGKFIKEIDPTIRTVFHDGKMESAPIQRIVFINIDEFLYVYDDEKLHKQVLKEKGMLLDIELPIFILLHEIGHIKSIENYKTKRALLRQYENQVRFTCPKISTIDDLRKYKNIKLEKMADDYAYNFYLHNYNFVKELNKQILDLLN